MIDAVDSLNQLSGDERIRSALVEARKALDAEDFSVTESLCESVLKDPSMEATSSQKADALLLLAELHITQGRIPEAISRTTEAIAAARVEGDEFLLAMCGLVMARIGYALEEFAEALNELERIRPVVTAAADDRLLFRFQLFAANCHLALGQCLEAIQLGESATQVAERLGEARLLVLAKGSLASYWYAEANRLSGESRSFEANLALNRALALNMVAIETVHTDGAQRGHLSYLSNHALILEGLKREDEAIDCLAAHKAFCVQLDDYSTLSTALMAEARLNRRRGNSRLALDALRRGICMLEEAACVEPGLFQLASELEEEQGNFAQALADFKRMHAIITRSSALLAEHRSLSVAAKLEAKRVVGTTLLEKERTNVLRRENLELEHKAKALTKDALEDPLTGLANRRKMDTYLESWHREALGNGSPAWLAMIDVDYFKQVNDRFSHACGDKVLQLLGTLLQSTCRRGDLAGRLGGEEFLLCLDVHSAEQAFAACERIRKAVAEYNWEAVAKGLAVTISVGLADLSKFPTLGEGLGTADHQLYRAKNSGRNQVCLAH